MAECHRRATVDRIFEQADDRFGSNSAKLGPSICFPVLPRKPTLPSGHRPPFASNAASTARPGPVECTASLLDRARRRGLRLCSPFGARRARQIASFAIAAAALFDPVGEHKPRLRHFQHSGLQSRIRKPLRHGEAVRGVLAIFFVSVHGHTHATLSFCANVASDDGWLNLCPI